ncbi:MAG: toll/interleukin-1 receptor domain-containing protein [Candidatus Magnetoovum sp. WYHC-5]|nr:toll/interleukin-1 receptor domain-containing protein [Candidatus Magnetoovum sp. WYHC-5]
MNVFISWSKDKSRETASSLRELIKGCLAPINVWTSHVDMEAGTKWYFEIENHLEKASVGIVCITAENLSSPWLLFEAGAMLKAKNLIPYLVGISTDKLPGPLKQYPVCTADRDGTLKLLKALDLANGSVIEKEILETRFDTFWPTADHRINGAMHNNINKIQYPLGVEGIFKNRSDGYDWFVQYLRAEAESQGPNKRLWIIGSSLQGFDVGGANRYTIFDAIEKVRTPQCLRVLLTDPDISHYREKLEEKGKGQIEQEILASLKKLMETYKVPTDCIKLYGGTPTVSAIATSTHMLLNPYPYGIPAHKCFSLIVKKTSDDSDIYNQYIEAHFEKGWKYGKPLAMPLKMGNEQHKDKPEFLPQEPDPLDTTFGAWADIACDDRVYNNRHVLLAQQVK